MVEASKTVPHVTFAHLQQLRLFLGDPSGAFRTTEQASATILALEGQHDLLFVSGTGSGKSLVFLLPAFIEQSAKKTTIVVVPLVALTKDLIDRCKRSNITYDVWSGEF